MLRNRLAFVYLVLAIAIGMTFALGVSESAEGVLANEEKAAKSAAGPPNTDFNSPDFRIAKVVRMEQNLNALGIAGQFGKTNKVGKYVELPKRLEPAERGEHFVITWKHSPKSAGLNPQPVRLVFDYKLSNEEHLETITRDYANLQKGTYRLRVENTGPSYRRRGYIEYWRARVFADGKLVARKESFLWPVFHTETAGANRESY